MIQHWNAVEIDPPSGVAILIKMKDGRVCEGHFIKHANRYVKNVNRYRLHDGSRKTYKRDEISGWVNVI